ncbi:unnamed protein product [Periconia digitata]|uniref:MARVEL domain-containing protein n=1 Tax=Periconia digitata TaxID=1303443 RepID=A0A9W4XS84_9PLEO|nr:unnamed protein product [Periconia digitata]
MMGSIAVFAIRGVQFLVAVIILGLSVNLVVEHKWGSLPATLGFTVFVSGISLVAVLAGFASIWVEKLQGKIGMIIDGVVALINVAGGALILIKLKDIDCKDESDTYRYNVLQENDLLNGGCIKVGKDIACLNMVEESRRSRLNGRCKQSQADAAFMFILVAALVGSATLAFLRLKRGH